MDHQLDDFALEKKHEVIQKVENLLNEIRKEKPYLDVVDTTKHGEEDVFILFLKGKRKEISKLKAEIDGYYNASKHFTKQYRTLEGHCSKLQRDLDKVDVYGRDDLAAKRKTALLDVNGLIKTLATKAHPNGIVCSECEVKV